MVATTLTGQGPQEELYGPLIEKAQVEFMRYQSTTTLSVFLDSLFDIEVIGLTSLSWAVLHTLCMSRSAQAQAMHWPLIGEISARASSRPSVRQLVPPYSNCGRGNSKVLLRLCCLGKHVPVPVGTVLATEENSKVLLRWCRLKTCTSRTSSCANNDGRHY